MPATARENYVYFITINTWSIVLVPRTAPGAILGILLHAYVVARYASRLIRDNRDDFLSMHARPTASMTLPYSLFTCYAARGGEYALES